MLAAMLSQNAAAQEIPQIANVLNREKISLNGD